MKESDGSVEKDTGPTGDVVKVAGDIVAVTAHSCSQCFKFFPAAYRWGTASLSFSFLLVAFRNLATILSSFLI